MYEDFENNNPKWMKLVDLYNERWKEKWGDDELCFTYEMRFDTVHLISKEMGFIKRLVENDKINLEKEIKNSELNWLHEHYFREDCLIMLLARQDEPINFLIQLLK